MENTAILKEWFQRVDSEKTGSITATQLKSALEVGNLQFPLSVVQQMIRMYDFDRNGTMSFEEFVALNKFLLKVQHAFSDLESKTVNWEAILASSDLTKSFIFTIHLTISEPGNGNYFLLSSKLQGSRLGCLLLCKHLKGFTFNLLQGRGYLLPDDVYEGVAKIGFSLDSPAFYTVCESFDQKKNGRFRLDDFISLSMFLQSTRNLFNSFDTAKQGRITLDLNQFVYCTANCRI